jgi:hypothetical protein|tara:strand:+ start:1520 stop:1885 length:366 start_codon:yes stop_codon:yes gene_type:complete
MSLEKEIFNGKTLADLFSEIHSNSTTTRTQVKGLIGELKPLIENIGDATLVVPMIKEYMDIGVKNDDALLKLAAIIQRIEANSMKGESVDAMFSPEELAQLLETTEDIIEEVENVKEEKEE